MADERLVELLRSGPESWNQWRVESLLTVPHPDLTDSDLRAVALPLVNFGGADLSGADLTAADLKEAFFGEGTHLERTRFCDADLRGTVFSARKQPINFMGTDFRRTDLREAVLEADFSGANLENADLRGADLRGAELAHTNLDSALFSLDTQLPPRFDAVQHGMILAPAGPQNSPSDEFLITFDPSLSGEQIREALSALADYYRVCGGVGLQVEFETEIVRVAGPVHA